MNNVKNNLIYRVFFVGFLSIFSICLLLLPFSLNKTNNTNLGSSFESNGLHLDESTQTEFQFTGSALTWLVNYYKSTASPGATPNSSYVYARDSLGYHPLTIAFDFASATRTLTSHASVRYYNNYSGAGSTGWLTPTINTDISLSVYDTLTDISLAGFPVFLTSSFTSMVNYSIKGAYYLPTGFNFDIRGVTITGLSNIDNNQYKNAIVYKYIDNNGLELSIYIYLGSANYLPTSRTYWFVQGESLTDNSFYQQGFNDGKQQGIGEGDTIGYNRGFTDGYSSGESSGYLEGIEAGSDVSFLALIGATIDAPIKAFTGLFDFDISMGDSSFNIKGFLLAILTVAIVIAFVRLILAK